MREPLAAPAGPPGGEVALEDTGHPQRWRILAVLCTSLAVVIVANTTLNVALPAMARDLSASTTELQWIIDAYGLVFAGLLFTAGTLGDRFGRKGALQAGLLIFLGAAIAASFMDSAVGVIACRAVMGMGAALVMPATLSILTNVFPRHERTRAIAMWAAVSGAGGAIGPIASGFLLEHYSWSAVFLINVPVIVVAAVAVGLLVPTSSDPEHTPIDWIGAVLSIIGVAGLVYVIIEAPIYGWASARTLGTGVAALAVLGLFALWELRTPHPMLDLRYFRDRGFSVGSAGMALVFFALFGLMFLSSQYFQLVLGYSALQSGLGMLPLAFVMVLVAPQTPKLVLRFGANLVVGVGLALVAIGALLFSQVQVDSPYLVIAGIMGLMAAGMALGMTPLTTAIMAGVPRAKAGVGSAMNDTTREMGGALGVAVLGSLVTTQYASAIAPSLQGLPPEVATLAESGLSGALAVAERVGESAGPLVAMAQQAFVDGMSSAMLAGGALVGVAALLAWRFLPASLPDIAELEGGGLPEHTSVDGALGAPGTPLVVDPAFTAVQPATETDT